MKLINDNFDDYFEGNAPARKSNEPYVETEEEREERELNETTIERRSNRKRIMLIVGSLVLLFFLFFLMRCQYYNPELRTTKGQVVDVVLSGTVFKTYECTFNEIGAQNPNGIVKKEFKFSVTSDSLAKTLNELKQTNIPVHLFYREYKSSLPWRGNTRFIADSIKTELPIQYVNTLNRANVAK